MKNHVVVTFGEVMCRMAAPGWLRLRQAMPGPLETSFSGAEANVAVSIAMLGGQARLVTALPRHPITEACLASLRGYGVDVESVALTQFGRLGIYFIETGANQRPSTVVYDRDGSAISLAPPDTYDWPAIFRDADWFHTTGITPSLSENAAQSVLTAVQEAKARGLTVSLDLNFRKKLWRWRPGTEARALAGEVMNGILPHVDVLIGNEEDAADVLGIHAEGSDVESGVIAADRYRDVARRIHARYGNLSRIAITLRESISASHNNWGGMLYETATDTAHFAPQRAGHYAPYAITDIVDRVGAGDAFGAALIVALRDKTLHAPADAVAFAAAASCLCHSIVNDFNLSTRAEVETLMRGSGTGRVVR